MKKVFLSLLGILLLTGCSDDITLKEVTVESNKTLPYDVSFYAEGNFDDCTVDLSAVLTKVGTYDYKINCGESEYIGKINVIDTKFPFAMMHLYYTNIDSEFDPSNSVEYCSQLPCSYDFGTDLDIKNVTSNLGLFEHFIKVSDENDNAVDLSLFVQVIEEKIIGDIRVYIHGEYNENIVGISYMFPIGDEDKFLGYGDVITTYEYSDSEFVEILKEVETGKLYGKYGQIVVDEETNSIKFRESMNMDKINEYFMGVTFNNKEDIMTYFESLDYTYEYFER